MSPTGTRRRIGLWLILAFMLLAGVAVVAFVYDQGAGTAWTDYHPH